MARSFVLGLNGLEQVCSSEENALKATTEAGSQCVIEGNTMSVVENPDYVAPAQQACSPEMDVNQGFNM